MASHSARWPLGHFFLSAGRVARPRRRFVTPRLPPAPSKGVALINHPASGLLDMIYRIIQRQKRFGFMMRYKEGMDNGQGVYGFRVGIGIFFISEEDTSDLRSLMSTSYPVFL